MRSVRARIIVLIATVAIAPLLVYGVISVTSLRRSAQGTAQAGNLAVARQVAERVALYFDTIGRILSSAAVQMKGNQLADWQVARVLRNHVLDFPEFREISIFEPGGAAVSTSRTASTNLSPPPPGAPLRDGVYIAPPRVDKDGLPTTILALPLEGERSGRGWIVAEISLEQLWRSIDEIRVGTAGYALLLDDGDRLIAHGLADEKRLVAEGSTKTPQQDLARALRLSEGDTAAHRLTRLDGTPVISVAAAVRQPRWTVIVEQPESEAFAVARTVEQQLSIAIAVALLATVLAGSWWGRAFIRRISALSRVSRDLARGQMQARVPVTGRDEIAQLGAQFNAMADRLVELQDEIRQQERQATFGRMAAGLAHDLLQPIQIISQQYKLIQRLYDDAEFRTVFAETIERELATVRRVLDDLRNIARPKELERFPVDVRASLGEAFKTMAPFAETAGVALQAEFSDEPLYIEADLFALGRVYRNLILNAIQATAPGGLVAVVTEAQPDRAVIKIHDTGCGIPAERLQTIFDDFVTTKKRGLGLGLAISKRIVEQLEGRIRVTSEVGRGTTFMIEFPRTAVPAAQAAG